MKVVKNESKVKFPLEIEAIVIDLDGTLLDTAPDLASAANGMLGELGFPSLDQELISTFIGKGVPNLVRRTLAASLGNDPEEGMVERGLAVYGDQYYKTLAEDTRVYPGVKEGLDRMRDRGFSLGCITNKSERFTLPLLRLMKLDGYFELVLSGDSLPEKKPHPLPLLHASRYFGIPPQALLLVGDSVNDVLAARAAGCPVFCVPYGYNEGRRVEELDYDALVANLSEVVPLIRKPVHGKAVRDAQSGRTGMP